MESQPKMACSAYPASACSYQTESAKRRPPYGGVARTRTRPWGAAPNISGAYSASTRLGGSAKSPALFRRTVYSTVTVPWGRYA